MPISLERFLKDYKKLNPMANIAELRMALVHAVNAKKNGAVCAICGQPIWAIGMAIVDWEACFTCITGEADCSEDYEISSVCFF